MANRRKRIPSAVKSPFLRHVSVASEGVDTASYPFNIPAFSKGIDLDFATRVTFFVGENGSGKSTLLEAIAQRCGFNAEGGGRDHHFGRDEELSPLARALELSWSLKVNDGFFMRAESFFNFASYLEESGSTFNRYGGTPLHQQSHGESFLALFANRFDAGIYILDEPEAALSPARQLSFLSIVHRLERGGNAQFLISTHSPIIFAYPGATVLSLDGDAMTRVDFKSTEHYRLTKQFLDSPERFFKHLFDEDSELE